MLDVYMRQNAVFKNLILQDINIVKCHRDSKIR